MDTTETKTPRPDRAGLKTVVTYLPAEVAKMVKMLAVQRDRTVQDICEEAIGAWLKANATKADLLWLKDVLKIDAKEAAKDKTPMPPKTAEKLTTPRRKVN